MNGGAGVWALSCRYLHKTGSLIPMAIIVSKDGGNSVKLDSSSFEDEKRRSYPASPIILLGSWLLPG
jgi:hypothetical protein